MQALFSLFVTHGYSGSSWCQFVEDTHGPMPSRPLLDHLNPHDPSQPLLTKIALIVHTKQIKL